MKLASLLLAGALPLVFVPSSSHAAAVAAAHPASVETRPSSPARAAPAAAREAPVRSLEKLGSAKDELARADRMRREMRGTSGDDRLARRKLAVEAYRSVREHFPQDLATVAEAAFRAGELLRAAGEVDAARNELQVALAKGASTPFRVRARMELGQIARRSKDPQAALEAFDAVIADAEASQRQKDDALLWSGRAYADLGRGDDARRAWQRVADGAEDPLDRVRAFDWTALAYVDSGDLEAAAGALERCRDALADVAAEETKLGERVRNALADMRAHDDLARAIAERDAQRAKSGADARPNDSRRVREERSRRE